MSQGTSRPSQLSQPRTNGCSYSPDGSFLDSCNSHDVCYDNLSGSKEGCDIEFKDDLYDSYDSTSPHYAMNKICKGAANIYYGGVVIGGNTAYYVSQEESLCASWWSVYDATCGKLNG